MQVAILLEKEVLPYFKCIVLSIKLHVILIINTQQSFLFKILFLNSFLNCVIVFLHLETKLLALTYWAKKFNFSKCP